MKDEMYRWTIESLSSPVIRIGSVDAQVASRRARCKARPAGRECSTGASGRDRAGGPARAVEREVVEGEAVLAQQKIGLIQAMLAQRLGRRVVFQRRVAQRPEGGKVGARQAHFAMQIGDRLQDLGVAFVGAADAETRNLARAAPAVLAPNLLDDGPR